MPYHADEESLDQTRLHNGALGTMEDILGDNEALHSTPDDIGIFPPTQRVK